MGAEASGPRLLDHMYEDEVNRAAGGGRSFKEVFDDLGADDTLDEVRTEVSAEGVSASARDGAARTCSPGPRCRRRCNRRDGSCARWSKTEIEDEDGARQKPRYLRILREFGFGTEPDDPAFVTALGDRIPEDTFEKYLQELRGVRINMEFNGAMCRGLLSTRYKEAKLDEVKEPTLVDFIHGNVPARARASAD